MYKINLLPPELQRDVSIDFKTLAIRASVTVVAMAVLAFYCVFLYSMNVIKNEISLEEEYLLEIQPTVKLVEEIKKQRLVNEQAIQKYQELTNKRTVWYLVLKDLNNVLPADIWLESVDVSYVERQNPGEKPVPQAVPPVFLPGDQAQAPQGQVQAKPATPGEPVEPQPVFSLPTPNTLTLEGYSRTTPSVGIFVHNLCKMTYFSKVTLNETGEDEKKAAFRFKITAAIKESGR